MPIQREFLDWRKPALAAAAEFLRARFERDGALDLSGVIVVVPGSRAGRRLLEILVALADTRQLVLTPPEIVTIDTLLTTLYEPKVGFADRLTRLFAWLAALKSFAPARLTPFLPSPPQHEDTLQWLALAGTLQGLQTELTADGISFRKAMECATGIEGFDEHDRWQILFELERAYLDALDKLNLWDVQIAHLVAIEKREINTCKHVVLLGMVDLNHTQRQMLDQIADRVFVLVIAPNELQHRFDKHGCLLPDQWIEVKLPLADEQIERVDGPSEQAEAVTRWLGGLGGRFAADQVVVGLGETRLVPQLERQLAQFGIASRFAEAKKLRETGPYRLLKVAAEYASRGRFRDLAALMRHPDVEEWLWERGQGTTERGEGFDVITVLDRFASERFPARLDEERLAKDERAAEVLAIQQAVGRLVKPLMGDPQALGAWAEKLRSVLVEVYGKRTLDRTSDTDRYVLAALEQLGEVLDTVAALPVELQPVVNARQASRIVLDAVGDNGLPPPANPNAVELLGWLELPLDDAPALVVTTFNEGLIPKATSADSFLPNRLREALGLLHNDRRLARDAYALSVLLAARAELRLIVAHRDAEGNPLAPSRLLFAADTEGVVRRAQWLFGELPPVAPRRPLLAPPSGPQKRSLLVPPKPQRLSAPIAELSVTKFRDYIACPYRFYLRHVLALESISDQAAELDGGTFGGLVHLVLEQFGRTEEAAKARTSVDPKEIIAFLDWQLERVTAARYGQQVRPAVRVQIEQIRMRLRAFAEWQARRTREGWRIVFSEDSEERKPALTADFPVDGKPFTLKGRIDRVDYHEESQKLVVLDYKTADEGEPPEKMHRRGDEWVDLQLPLYRHLVRAAKIGGKLAAGAEIQLGYVLLPRDLARVDLARANWDEAALRSADEKAREIIRAIRGERFWPPQDPPNFADDLAVICQDHRLGVLRLGQEGDAA